MPDEKHLRYITTDAIFNSKYYGEQDYEEPWVSYIEQSDRVKYNKKGLDQPLTFEILSAGTIVWTMSGSYNTARTIQYSKNGGSWTNITSTANGVSVSVTAGDYIRFRGNNERYGGNSSTSTSSNNFSKSTAVFNIFGNIMSMLSAETYSDKAIMPDWNNFSSLFAETNVVDASGLLLPATTVQRWSYQYMFKNCAKLIAAPKLPATTLGDNCYSNMFYGCGALKKAPELPSTTLTDSCYWQMFAKCSGLTEGPNLPATEIVGGCYTGMLNGCTGLKKTPEMKGQNLVSMCYENMFYGCTSLEEAMDELPGGEAIYACCTGMFANCGKLKKAPKLPATSVGYLTYRHMFLNCSGLTEAPELPATELGHAAYYGMFNGCKNLVQGPSILPALSVPTSGYGLMFYGCEKLKNAPSLPATTLSASCYAAMFYNCKNITTMPLIKAETFSSGCSRFMFQSCTKLNHIKCMANCQITTANTSQWVYSVSSSGTFVKNPFMSGWTMGMDGIPASWSVIDDGVYMANSGTSMSIIHNNANENSSYIIVSATTEWSAITDCGWITVNPWHGKSGTTSVTIVTDSYNGTISGDVGFISTGVSSMLHVIVTNYLTQPLTFEITGGSGKIAFVADTTGVTKTIEYSKNGGSWISVTSSTGTSGTTVVSVTAGDKVQFRGNNTSYGEMYNQSHLTVYPNNCTYNICGNIMSLINKNNFQNLRILQSSHTFRRIFYRTTLSQNNLKSAKNLLLPATKLTYGCYYEMFYRCQGLTDPPMLPATNLNTFSYAYMFSECDNLAYAPELPATEVGDNSYQSMFNSCYKLTSAPKLPATKLNGSPYSYMFSYCSGLTSGPSVLPATKLTYNCYYSMFAGCKSLTSAPILPAKVLPSNAHYDSMFKGCTNLRTIKCFANSGLTTGTNSGLGNYFTSGVSATGTFYRDPSATSWPTGINGIPNGWTVNTSQQLVIWFDELDGWDDFKEAYEDKNWDSFAKYYSTHDLRSTGINAFYYTNSTMTFRGITYYVWENYFDDDSLGQSWYVLTETVDFARLYEKSLEANKYNRWCPFRYMVNDDSIIYMRRLDDGGFDMGEQILFKVEYREPY